MQFNDHQEKYKQEDIRGIHGEQFRELSSYKNYVDPSRTLLNRVHVFNPQFNSDNWNKRIKECKKIHEQTTGKSLRKDAVVFISDIATVPKEWPIETTLQYFEERNIFMEEFLFEHGVKKEYLLSSVIHMDETEPHQTIVYIPFKDGKFQAKNITNKIMLKQLQSKGWDFYKDFETRHPEIEKYRLEPYEVGGTDHKKKKKHLEETEYKIQQEEKKLQDIQNNINDKESELQRMEDQIIDNPAKRMAEDRTIMNSVNEIVDQLSTSKKDYDVSYNDPALTSKMPLYDKSDWLEKDVKIVEAKKDLFGNEKSPAHVEIAMDEWNRKIKIKISNEHAFDKISNLLTDLRTKYINLLRDLRVLLPKVDRKVTDLVQSFKKLFELPSMTTWKSINKDKQTIENLESTISSLLNKVNDFDWFHNFYQKTLLVLHESKTKNGLNALEKVLKDYDPLTQREIQNDLKELLPNEYEAISYHDGISGYGWYGNSDQEIVFLGKKKELESLLKKYPQAEFKDPYNHVFDMPKYRNLMKQYNKDIPYVSRGYDR